MEQRNRDQFPLRKHPRLKSVNYNENGAYFITICTHNKVRSLSHVVVGRGLAPAEIRLTKYGVITESELKNNSKRYPDVNVDHYVIMPNHIHMLLTINASAGASPRPTVMDVICSFKSLSTRICNQSGHQGKLFQTSFHDHIIRNEKDYLEIWQYIEDNPAKWAEDKYYNEK